MKQDSRLTNPVGIHWLVHGNVIPMGIPLEMSHRMGQDSTHLYFPWDSETELECQNVTEMSYLGYTSEF